MIESIHLMVYLLIRISIKSIEYWGLAICVLIKGISNNCDVIAHILRGRDQSQCRLM